ncbi:MAG: hypothetical protein NW203_02605 [Hyphomonadaceae bacterium]|nr:hypothetical protein [Hyphomonadaceae bacterium]
MSDADAPFAPPERLTTADGLRLFLTTTAKSPVFERFFAGYDRAFVLPNEKEDAEGFARCFDLNHGADYARLSALYGPYREVSFVAEDAADGATIGGANFIAMPVADAIVTANLNYIYIEQARRGKGDFSRLYAAVREAVASAFPAQAAGGAQVLIFIEQNDPFRMSEEDYRRDSDFTGLDQFDRLRIWAKRGAKVVDFSYVQPPLSADQDADDTLLYSVLGAPGDSLSACVLEGHLRRFFGVSVLKGANLADNKPASAQVEALHRGCIAGEEIALLDPAPLLSRIRVRDDAFALWQTPPKTGRDAVRAAALL